MKMLKQTTTGRAYPWTEQLAKRSDMKLVQDRTETDAGEVIIDPVIDGVYALSDKVAIEKYGREHGVELNRTRSVKNMQADFREAMVAKRQEADSSESAE